MLKPGGYLQWDDIDRGLFKGVALRLGLKPFSVPITAIEELVATSLQS
jgi:hypothetical protein